MPQCRMRNAVQGAVGVLIEEYRLVVNSSSYRREQTYREQLNIEYCGSKAEKKVLGTAEQGKPHRKSNQAGCLELQRGQVGLQQKYDKEMINKNAWGSCKKNSGKYRYKIKRILGMQ